MRRRPAPSSEAAATGWNGNVAARAADGAAKRRNREQNLAPEEGTIFWQSNLFEDLYFFKARFLTHAYSRHTHARYAVGAMESGAQTYWCRGEQQVAAPGSLCFINPEEPHDGRNASGEWYIYRMLYIGPAHFRRAVAEMTGRECGEGDFLPLFRQAAAEDPPAARKLLDFHLALEDGTLPALEAESRLLDLLLTMIRRHASYPPGALQRGRHSALVRHVTDYLHEHLAGNPTLTDLARFAGMTRFHLLRQFKRDTGMAPHTFLTQLRLRHAQQLLRQGEPAAMVAAATGFVDQSHLNKRFRSAYGLTPIQFLRGCR